MDKALLHSHPLPPLSRLAFAIVNRLAQWEIRRHTRTALTRLEPHLLRDIGLTEQQAAAEISKPFWQD
jgi:uncharacterized protein YjiS (DUF1127 family)